MAFFIACTIRQVCRALSAGLLEVLFSPHSCMFTYRRADIDRELVCGSEGEEACLDTDSASYSCRPFADDGTPLNAVQFGPDPNDRREANAPFMCLRCGTEGGLACDRETCGEGLTVVEDEGNRYCEPPRSPAPPPSPPCTGLYCEPSGNP